MFSKALCPMLTQAEGTVLGVGGKMFQIAGPIIVYGVLASVVYGVICWVTTRTNWGSLGSVKPFISDRF